MQRDTAWQLVSLAGGGGAAIVASKIAMRIESDRNLPSVHYSGRKIGIKSSRPTGRSESDPMMEVDGSDRRRKGNILHHFRYEWPTSLFLLLKRRGLFITELIGRVNGHQISAYKGWNQGREGGEESIFRRIE